METRTPSAAERLATAKRKQTDLKDKLAATEAEVSRLEAKRANLAYVVHATGDGEATVLVEEINAQLVPLRLDIETLKIAVEKAEQLVAQAEDPKNFKEDQRVARYRLERNAVLKKHAQAADEALATFREHYDAIREELISLSSDGVLVGMAIIDPTLKRCLHTALQQTPLAELIGSGLRGTFSDAVGSYIRQVEGWANRRLAGDTPPSPVKLKRRAA